MKLVIKFLLTILISLVFSCTHSKKNELQNLIFLGVLEQSEWLLGAVPEIKQNLNYSLVEPNGMALERGGKSIWIVDSGTHTVHLWNFNQGIAKVVLGKKGEMGSTNDMGTLARFSRPAKIALDDHSILISEENNHTIRRVYRRKDNQFLVQTFLGQAGTSGTANGGGISTQFNTPRGIYHLSGTIVIADSNNHALRLAYINDNSTALLGGLIGTSGTDDGSTNRQRTSSTARFNSPSEITYLRKNLNSNDPYDMRNIFVVDTGNHTIRKIKNVWVNDNTFSTGGGNAGSFEISTISGLAGTSGSNDGSLSEARFNAPESIVADEENAYLYVADTGNHVIRRINLLENKVTTIAGISGQSGYRDGASSQALFKNPKSIFLFKPYLLISDSGNGLIRELNLNSSVVRTVLGKP